LVAVRAADSIGWRESVRKAEDAATCWVVVRAIQARIQPEAKGVEKGFRAETFEVSSAETFEVKG